MVEKKYTVYYNTAVTKSGAHLLAVGWVNEGGWKAVLGEVEGSSGSRYRFTLEATGDAHSDVIVPFVTAVEMSDPPRSVSVEDDHGNECQVQVHDIIPVGSGNNTSSEWVEA